MAFYLSKVEFDLTVKKYGEKGNMSMYDPPMRLNNDKEPEFEVKEELNFKSLSAVEVVRKLLDYLKD
jgi:hypothetical protein